MKTVIRNILLIVAGIAFISVNYKIINDLTSLNSDKIKLKPKIVVISHVLSNPYWNYIKHGAEVAAFERNAVIEFQGPDTADTNEGIKLIKMAYSAKVGGVITYVQEQRRYLSTINKLVASGMPVVTIDSDAEKSKRLAYVGTNNYEAGVTGAKELTRQMGKSGNVAIIVGGRLVKNQLERIQGFKEYLLKNTKIKIVEVESSNSYLLEAELAAKRLLKKHNNLKAVFCTSALDGIGAEKAVSGMQLSQKVKIICFDDLPETLSRIKDGRIAASIVQKPYYMGYKAVQIIMDKIEGKYKQQKNKGLFLTGVEVVTKDNVDAFIKRQKEGLK